MPIITIETWPMSPEHKTEAIQKITKVFTDQGIPAQAITVLVHETPQENWATAGEQHSITYKHMKR
jgi:4-oxalocrotonate tautomerase family enzyme